MLGERRRTPADALLREHICERRSRRRRRRGRSPGGGRRLDRRGTACGPGRQQCRVVDQVTHHETLVTELSVTPPTLFTVSVGPELVICTLLTVPVILLPVV